MDGFSIEKDLRQEILRLDRRAWKMGGEQELAGWPPMR
jgi:hypothetical protein